MLKITFDKNDTFSVRRIAEVIYAKCPEDFAHFDSCCGCVNHYIKISGIKPVNKQKNYRCFSGIDSQQIYDHFCSKVDDSVPLIETNKTYPRVSVELRCKEGQQLEFRSRSGRIAKVDIVAEALREYFNNHPFDPYEGKSREDLIEEIKRLKGEV